MSEISSAPYGGVSYTEWMMERDDEAMTGWYGRVAETLDELRVEGRSGAAPVAAPGRVRQSGGERKTTAAKDPDVRADPERPVAPTPRGNAEPPRSRQERVLEAATDVFLWYGFARTTMGDIAERAGISRPTLYLVFPGKEEVFAAVIRRMTDEQFASIRAALPTLPTLREKLLFVCETWGVHGFTLTTAHLDARDLFNLAFIPVQQMYAEFQVLLAALLAEPVAASSMRATPEELARVLAFAMRGFRETVADEQDVRRLIALQVSLLLTALEGGPPAP